VRRQVGLELVEDPIDHLIAGLLVDGADDWPDDLQVLGKAGDIHFLVFPQGGGKIRLYADYDSREQNRFSGPEGAERFLAAFDMECVPGSRAIAGSTPIGPCRAYPSQCALVDDPRVDGVVLMGDAAGFNDPILGQGLSVTLRDARWLRDLLTGGEAWDVRLFAPWVEERRERMSRLRFVANMQAELFARFDAESLRRRERAVMRIAADPELLAGVQAAYVGPELLPAEVFTDEFRDRLFGE
jgi:2-polyprenyl-6-methoxyphenol hydroxylase-like FAD-dependent oxidoreductase